MCLTAEFISLKCSKVPQCVGGAIDSCGKMIKKPVFLWSRHCCQCRFSHLRVCDSANKERHVGHVAPQHQHKRLQGRESVVGPRERHGGGSPGFDPLLGQSEEGLVSDIIQDQRVFGVEAAQVGTFEE